MANQKSTGVGVLVGRIVPEAVQKVLRNPPFWGASGRDPAHQEPKTDRVLSRSGVFISNHCSLKSWTLGRIKLAPNFANSPNEHVLHIV